MIWWQWALSVFLPVLIGVTTMIFARLDRHAFARKSDMASLREELHNAEARIEKLECEIAECGRENIRLLRENHELMRRVALGPNGPPKVQT